ncbi:hypothetical protein, conserved [Thermococcus kodakarensis KOD1]|uniref:Peptidase C39-like domain-containing protein n=1 Tax=Thermococcus kodakarensis (strain ATCC BAA-918 / JCM 12380 / KOD1) TaxID=69014 RepID=Q5JDU8_THEKO|nr:hypothetical protein [Thermococcus kodakarensis]WCN27665.1 hypothetical protein POG15_08920 [Thermococcus kodakarensis]WCN29956.1 hypothetical protein POG21_08905 [Thermococcus kodakarensis]BAD85939.1 hypothetical protein, conserved [Thermococcus kodakarensis KOD1]
MKLKNRSLGILLMFLILGMTLLNTESYVFGDPALEVAKSSTKVLPQVSRNVALYLAKNELNSFPFMDFKGAEIGKKLVLFYFPDGRPAYYEVPLLKDGKVVGVMFIPALKTMPPGWMQVFEARKLVSQQLDKIAETIGIKHYRYVVLGAAMFGIQTEDGTVVDLAGREYRIDPSASFRFSIESKKNEVLWVKLEKDALKSSPRKIIEGVPTWTSTDTGNANIGYPNNVGPAPDPWGDWDGCSPIAASMVVAYYDSQFRSAYMREAIIDILHFTMGTDSSGRTEANGITKGIEDFYWEVMKLYNDGHLSVHPTYSYDATNREYSSDYQLFLAIKGEVDKNHPGLLNVHWRLRNGSIVGHSMTFVGYDSSVPAIYVHTTWKDLPAGWIKVGNWVDAMITTVKPIKMCWNGICPYVAVTSGG